MLPALPSRRVIFRWVRHLGGPGLLLYSIADGAPLPLPGGGVDLLLLIMAARQPRLWWYYAAMATGGGVLGGLLTWGAAPAALAARLRRSLPHGLTSRALAWLQARGSWGVFWAALLPPPFPFTMVTLASGLARQRWWRVALALLSGRALRFGLVAWLGARLGSRIVRQLHWPALPVVEWVALAAFLVILSGLAWRLVSHRQRRLPQRAASAAPPR